MYEARRQRSSWARIKLSIVRKVMSISYSLLNKMLDFFVVRSFVFELTSFSISFTQYCVFLILLSMCNSVQTHLALSLKILSRYFFAIYYFNFGLFTSAFLRLLLFITQSLVTAAERRFPLRTFPSYRVNNYCQHIFLHFVTSYWHFFSRSAFARFAIFIFRLIGIRQVSPYDT